ncbi:MAG: SDR family oxidoreductase [Prolixibacteraceae bacterium]|jgi:NAD(P)-dependent dehydrogenase (short-subunit alcohol dehydrogenase family)|nr:SDR family oxidoreductase [Prolixibacteraceae bacterium]MBT6005972.1 SDR family oxidoreductase [Prolixibacteraceae bacterium]MBT6764885.1 SDR family oxidoreductase [Prolixibacteraceae bacterium]MBT7000753.1 SDR family oxidoreductase [Prolixibacteraceae bacterium]MBT7394871.1 SDR family oxidoreductase [Prolixibacteraceae bacterium]
MFSVKDKIIIVTGASGVIGSAISVALAINGAKLAILGRHEKKLQITFEKIAEFGDEHIQFPCDVLNVESLQKAKEAIQTKFEKIDALINVAGGATKGASTKVEFLNDDTPMEDSFFGVNLDDFGYTSDLNFMGSVNPIKVFGESMAEQKSGNIINISSMGAIQPLSKSPAYSAGKAAISNFTQWLAVHLSKVNIRVNAIAPGFILTEQNRFLLFDEKTGELTPRGKRIVDHTPQGKLGAPNDVISTIFWLLAEESSFITGITVPVDGGFSAYNGI